MYTVIYFIQSLDLDYYIYAAIAIRMAWAVFEMVF